MFLFLPRSSRNSNSWWKKCTHSSTSSFHSLSFIAIVVSKEMIPLSLTSNPKSSRPPHAAFTKGADIYGSVERYVNVEVEGGLRSTRTLFKINGSSRDSWVLWAMCLSFVKYNQSEQESDHSVKYCTVQLPTDNPWKCPAAGHDGLLLSCWCLLIWEWWLWGRLLPPPTAVYVRISFILMVWVYSSVTVWKAFVQSSPIQCIYLSYFIHSALLSSSFVSLTNSSLHQQINTSNKQGQTRCSKYYEWQPFLHHALCACDESSVFNSAAKKQSYHFDLPIYKYIS